MPQIFSSVREGFAPSKRRVVFLMLMLMVFILPSAIVSAQEAPSLDLSSLVDSIFEQINLFLPLAIEVMGLPFAIMIAFAIVGAIGMLIYKAFQSIRGGGG